MSPFLINKYKPAEKEARRAYKITENTFCTVVKSHKPSGTKRLISPHLAAHSSILGRIPGIVTALGTRHCGSGRVLVAETLESMEDRQLEEAARYLQACNTQARPHPQGAVRKV